MEPLSIIITCIIEISKEGSIQQILISNERIHERPEQMDEPRDSKTEPRKDLANKFSAKV